MPLYYSFMEIFNKLFCNFSWWSSKSDSAPVRGEAYEPAGLWTQQSQCRDVAQLRVGSGGCQNVMGGSEKFLYGMVRS